MNLFQSLKESARLEENYRTLARKGMGTETKNSARVGLELDFYEPKNGDKRFGKITKMSSKGYQVKDDKGKTYSFLFHDRKKAQSLLKGKSVSLRNQVEETQLDEVTDKEINAMRKVSKDMQKVLVSYQKIANMGDKELKNTKHNYDYEQVLKARDTILSMIGKLQTKQTIEKSMKREELEEGTMAIGIFDDNPSVQKKAIAGMRKLVKSIKPSTKVGSPEGKKFFKQLDLKYLSDDELADDFAYPKNKNMTVKDLMKKHEKRLGIQFEEVEEAVSPAQQAAIAIAKKEKGEKPKNESVMDSYRKMWEQGQKYAPKQELPEQDLQEIAVPRKEFEKIKKGNTVSVEFDSSMKKGHKMDLLVKSITRSNKYNVDKINMVAKDDPRNKTKFTFYSRGGKDATLAWGDMATVLTKYKVSR